MKKFFSVGRKSVYIAFVLALLCSVLAFGSMFNVQAAGTSVAYVDSSAGVDTNSGLTADAPVQSLEKAYELVKADGGTIYVVNTVSVSSALSLDSVTIARYSSNTDYMIEIVEGGTLTLTNVTVDGKDIDADYSAFNIAEGGTLTVTGGALQNNRAVSRVGGVTYNDGIVNLTNVLVTNNYSQYDGGAIYSFETGVVTSSGCTFSNNSVREGSSGVYYDGAAVYNRGKYTSINDNFTDNHSDFGGAVYNAGELTIAGGSFTNNTATRCGGALVNFANAIGILTNSVFTSNSGQTSGAVQNLGELTIDGCEFTLNTATTDGGAIYNGTSTTGKGVLTIKGDTLISKNTANDGGGIFNSDAIVNFESGIITENNAIHESLICFGGGVYNYGTEDNIAEFNMSGGSISNNYALDNGGGIYNNFDSIMNMSGGIITGNTALEDGGGVYLMERTTFDLTGGTISNNTAAQGAGVYNLSVMNMSGGTISGNTCESSTHTTNGGGIYITEDATLNLSGGSITGNSADLGSGIRHNGTFNLNSNGKVALDNDVRLSTGCYINVNGELSYTDTGAVITPSGYTYGRECVRADYGTAVASDLYEQFDLTPKNNYLFRPGDYIDDSAGIADTAVVVSTSYAVTYDANGGTNAPAAQIKYWNENLILSSDKPSKTGYIFNSWNTADDGSGTTYSSGATYSTNEALALYAQWDVDPNTAYKVEHWLQKVDGDASEKNSSNYDLIDTQNLFGPTNSSISPSTNTYTGFVAPSVQSVTISADGSLVVKYYYERESYILTINKRTGIDSVAGAGEYLYEESVSIDAVVSPGYIWNGWSGTYSVATQEYDFNMPSGNVTLVANATPITYTVDFNGNGADGGSMPSIPCTYDTETNLPVNEFTNTGYDFSGWNTAEDGSGVNYADEQSVENLTTVDGDTVVLYAQWEPITYTVEYNGNGNTGGSTASSNHTYDEEKALTANGFTKTGYVFDCWTTEEDGAGTKYTDKQVVENLSSVAGDVVTLYAQWKTVVVEVTFDANGGTVMPETMEVISSETYGTLPEPTRTGYDFDGWYTSPTGGSEVTEDTVVTKTEDHTVYAHWEPISYTVQFDGNGADGGDMDDVPYTYDESKALPKNKFSKTGYVFDCWNTQPDGSGVSYSDEALVKNLSSVDGDTVVLYAQWKFTPFPSHLRFIKDIYIETLLPSSKWRSVSLKAILLDVLDDDLSDTSSCEQVWHFTAEEFEEAREWCMNQEKGTDTNQAFLDRYTDSNRDK